MVSFSKYLYAVIGLIVVIGLIFCGFLYYQYEQVETVPAGLVQGSNTLATGTSTPTFVANTSTPTDESIDQAYSQINGSSSGAALSEALKTFVGVAANVNNTPIQRAEALNGINYAYTQSDFDAGTIRDVVFANAPFATYYSGTDASSTDPLHPTSGPDVAAVEAALVKLNELSNSLVPNQYALSRMEVAQVFASQRATVGMSAAQAKVVQASYAKQIEALAASYAALPPLSTYTTYPLAMRIQIMFAHASALAFVGNIEGDQTYQASGEALFQQAIQLGSSYATTNNDYVQVLDETLLARIFYASYYWNEYKTSDPQKIEDILQPLTDVSAIQDTTVYKTYLPQNANTKVAPFTRLRAIAAQMPALKTFLQSEGWTF